METDPWLEEPAPAIQPVDIEKQNAERENRRLYLESLRIIHRKQEAERAAHIEREKTTCNACGDTPQFLERDHRVPRSLGGSNSKSNVQHLCKKCHMRKSTLEVNLLNFSSDTSDIQEWFNLAFQNDRQKIETFVETLEAKAMQFRIVVNSIW